MKTIVITDKTGSWLHSQLKNGKVYYGQLIRNIFSLANKHGWEIDSR